MYLVVGSEDDALAREVCRQVDSAKLCSESDLLQYCQAGNGSDCLSGVIVRPQRRSARADLMSQEQSVECHDKIATLYSFFTSQSCPVVNRLGLSWWVQDSSYPRQLRLELAAVLGLAAESPREKTSYFGRLWPSARDSRSETRSVYVSGGLVRKASTNAEDIEDFLTRHTERLRSWQRSTGVYLCRLDFDAASELHLRHVEPLPMFDHEPQTLVREIAMAALEVTA